MVSLAFGADGYPGEELVSDYGYPKEFVIKSIEEQLQILQTFFPALKPGVMLPNPKSLPHGADGWFVIPRFLSVAGNYSEAMCLVTDLLRRVFEHRFENHLSGGLFHCKNFRQDRISSAAQMRLENWQRNYDFQVVPMQLGSNRIKRSPRRSQSALMVNQFGLRAFTVACAILTHPDRFSGDKSAWINCIGESYNDGRNPGKYESVPCFTYSEGKIRLESNCVSDTSEMIGAAIGFLPNYVV